MPRNSTVLAKGRQDAGIPVPSAEVSPRHKRQLSPPSPRWVSQLTQEEICLNSRWGSTSPSATGVLAGPQAPCTRGSSPASVTTHCDSRTRHFSSLPDTQRGTRISLLPCGSPSWTQVWTCCMIMVDTLPAGLASLEKGFPWWLSSRESACQCRRVGDMGLIPGSGRPPGEGNDNPLQYSYLENPMERSLVGHSPWGRRKLDRI